MVALSTRQHRLIDLLLEEQQRDITIAYVADTLGISPRTVHRELAFIETYLAAFDIKLLKKSGYGIRIAGTETQLQALQAQVHTKLPSELEASDRKMMLLSILLQQQEPIKLYSLARDLHVTMPTVGNDLDELESIVSLHQLKLIRRRGYGIELTGDERNKRKLIVTIVKSYLDESQIISYAHSNEGIEPIASQLLNLIGQQSFQAIEEILWSVQTKLNNPLQESSYTNLLMQISIALTRYQGGHPLPQLQKKEISAYEEQPVMIAEITKLIDDKLEAQLPIEERYNLSRLLMQAFEQDQQFNVYSEQPYLTEVIQRLTTIVEQYMQEPISKDASLSEGLVRHMLPAIQQIKMGQPVRNPMLSQIKKDYALLFGIIAQQVKELLPQWEIPEEEIGYITMHYGAALERIKQIPQQLKAVIVCTSGIGSSKMLAIRLAKEFPQIEQVGHYSWFEAARLPKTQYDFIVSTVMLPLEANPYIRLSPLITDEEIVKLKQFIKQHVQSRANTQSTAFKGHSEGEQWFRELQEITQAALQIINPFEVYSYHVARPESSIHQLLPELMVVLKENARDAIEDVHAVTEQLLLREEQGSIVLPDTTLALLHTRHNAVNKPLLALISLDVPLYMRNDDDATTIQNILFMLAPKQLDRYSLEILSEISAMLLQPELTELLQNADTTQIKSYISTQLEKHFKQKLNWRD